MLIYIGNKEVMQMFDYGNVIFAVAALGGVAGTILGFTLYALTEVAPQNKPVVERRQPLKKAA